MRTFALRFGLVLLAALTLTAEAASKKQPVRKKTPAAQAAPSAPVQTAFRRSPYVGAIVADAKTGKILFQDNAAQPAYPASVTKLMTLLLVLEDVRAGKYRLDDLVTATADVYKCEPSWIGIKPGETISVRDLCYTLMVESANDAAIALGVHASGSFEAFVARMNARAVELGMSSTRYYNPNGLPPKGTKYPWKSFNVSTAADQLKLALRLLKMDETLGFTSVKTCALIKTSSGYRVAVTRRVGEADREAALAAGETLVKNLRNHNNVMVKDKLKVINVDGSEAVDGLKTGYIDAGGSSIVLTARRGRSRVVVVVLGSARAAERDDQARQMALDALGAAAW